MNNHRMRNKITILGIGNTLYSDEGIGIHTVGLLEDLFANDSSVEVIEGATDGMRLLGPVEEADYLLIIDAINARKEPGTIIILDKEEIPTYFGVKMSIHQVGFQEVLMAAKLREKLPREVVMIGMQPASLELGIELSPIAKDALPRLLEAVTDQVHHWRERT